jgi:hypothetical protein
MHGISVIVFKKLSKVWRKVIATFNIYAHRKQMKNPTMVCSQRLQLTKTLTLKRSGNVYIQKQSCVFLKKLKFNSKWSDNLTRLFLNTPVQRLMELGQKQIRSPILSLLTPRLLKALGVMRAKLILQSSLVKLTIDTNHQNSDRSSGSTNHNTIWHLRKRQQSIFMEWQQKKQISS